MSDSDLSGRLPGPVTGRPRRPLSNSASTASCSIRFSLLTMISGAPRSSSRLSRLLRLMTRRYRSLRSEVAKRPPSSCTIGRRSGGITGTQSSTMPIGRVAGVEERGDDLEPLERAGLLLALAERMVSRRSRLGVEVEGLEQVLDGLGAHAAAEVLGRTGPAARGRAARRPQVCLTFRLAEVRPDLVEPVDLLGAVADLRISRSPPSRTLRRASLLAPSASSSARSASSFLAGSRCRSHRRCSSWVLISTVISASRDGRSRCAPRRRRGDHVGGEVDDLLEVLRRQVEQVAEPARHTLEVPDVRDRSGQLDVAHPLATHLGAR
jgi:hypothetical protein